MSERGRSNKLTIVFDVGDAGCLPGVLALRINETERHWRTAGHLYSTKKVADIERFLAQLRGCLAAVNEARARWVRLGTDAQKPS